MSKKILIVLVLFLLVNFIATREGNAAQIATVDGIVDYTLQKVEEKVGDCRFLESFIKEQIVQIVAQNDVSLYPYLITGAGCNIEVFDTSSFRIEDLRKVLNELITIGKYKQKGNFLGSADAIGEFLTRAKDKIGSTIFFYTLENNNVIKKGTIDSSKVRVVKTRKPFCIQLNILFGGWYCTSQKDYTRTNDSSWRTLQVGKSVNIELVILRN